MNKSNIEILNELVKTHPQFKTKSLLYDAIVQVLSCTLAEAKTYAATHCNLFSFWAIIKSSGYYNKSYATFFKWMLQNGHCNSAGYINSEKLDISKELSIESHFTKYLNIEDVKNEDKLYQVKIKGNTKGFHFMAGYLQDGVFYISDTSYRGIGVKATDHISEKNLVWIMEV